MTGISGLHYSGTYSVEGDKWTTNVEVAWTEWVGTKQVRDFKLDGERLMVLTPWRVMPNWADKVTKEVASVGGPAI
jgi:hypothetical protein